MNDFTLMTIKNDQLELTICNYGAMVYDLKCPDRLGVWESVVMQYAEDASILDNPLYLNAVVGPFAGRIAGASYPMDGQQRSMIANYEQTDSLHSGPECLAYQYFTLTTPTPSTIVATIDSPEDSLQFVGHQSISVTYEIIGSSLEVRFDGTTTATTLMNLTQHMYFNLSGNLKTSVLNHTLYVEASNALSLNDKLSPIGIESVDGTLLDFRQSKPLYEHLMPEILAGPTKGIDHPLLLDHYDLGHASAVLHDPASGRRLQVETTYPCLVVYTHNHRDSSPLRYQHNHPPHYGVCLEAQFEPNGMNVAGLHSSILRTGEQYHHRTRFIFGIE